MDCSICPEVSIGDWGQELLAPLGGRRYPLGATFEITERCNLACVHCFINQPAGSRAALTHEMTLTEVRAILDQMAGAGCLDLLLTGGEVLLRPDFAEIYRYAKGQGLLVTVFTNGTLLTPAIADLLAEWPPRQVEISLYGRTRETYERVTGVPGSYDRCMRGIELLKERGVGLGLKSIALTANSHELEQMRAFAGQLGVPFRYDAMLWPRSDGDHQPWTYRLSAEEIVSLDRNDPDRRAKWQGLDAKFSARLSRSDAVYHCGAGYHAFHVDAAGRMSLCMMARQPSYDLLQGSFAEGWEFLGALREEKRHLDTPCRTCTVGIVCIQCPGWSQMVHGDNETPVDWVCEVGRLRAAQILSSQS